MKERQRHLEGTKVNHIWIECDCGREEKVCTPIKDVFTEWKCVDCNKNIEIFVNINY